MSRLQILQRGEVREESSGIFKYSVAQLQKCPSHDFATKDGKLYRMYIAKHANVDLSKIRDNEHSNHRWVPVSSIIEAIEAGRVVICEEQQTVEIVVDDVKIPIYPPMYRMLKQTPMLQKLKEIQKNPEGELLQECTIGFDGVTQYYSIKNTAEYRKDIQAFVLNSAAVIREIKEKQKESRASEAPIEKTATLSQSELHMKCLLAEAYEPGNIKENVSKILDRYFKGESLSRREELINSLVKMIEKEKVHTDSIFFYHGCE